MREIKFRAWHLINEEYIDGDDILGGSFPYNQIEGITTFRIEPTANIILEQYTGLKDSDGKEIYEGDIVKTNWHNIHGKYIGNNWLVKFGEHETSLDYYASGAYGWYGETKTGEPHTLHDLPINEKGSRKVIGNIHENPELLKEKDDE